MKINNLTPPSQIRQADQGKPGDKPQADSASQASQSRSTVSTAALDSSRDIDMAKVNEIQQAIREGRLEIKADQIADGLIQSVRDMLDQDGK